MASLEKRYSGSMLTRVNIRTGALSWSTRLLPPPSQQSTELHPATGLWKPLSRYFLWKKDQASAKNTHPTCTCPARSLLTRLLSGRELSHHGVLADTWNAGISSLKESSQAVAKCTGIGEIQTRVQIPAPQFTVYHGQVSQFGMA